MSELCDTILILNEAATGYLARTSFHSTCLLSSSSTYYPIISQPIFDKIRKIVTKKWPDVQSQNIEKDKNYPEFVTQANGIVLELEDMYNTFVLIHDWLLKSHAVLSKVLIETTNIDSTTARFSFVQILSLLTNHIKIVFMLHALVVPLKLMTCVYSHACLATSDMREKVAYKFLSKLLTSISSTVTSKLENDFQTVAPHIARMLLSVQPIHQRLTNLHGLDSSGALDFMSNMRTMSQPNHKHDIIHQQSQMYGNYREWIVLGYLTCPSALIETTHFEWLQVMLSDGWVLEICRDTMVITTHSIWMELFSWYPKKIHIKNGIKFPKSSHGKPKKIIQHCEINSIENSLSIHAERRRFCARVLGRLCTTLAHTPGLVAPRCMTIMTALALTKCEILFYYQHVGQLKMLSSKKLYKKKEGIDRDMNISKLMHLMSTLTSHIRNHRMLIGRYYHEYITKTHCIILKGLLNETQFTSTLEEKVRPILKVLLSMPKTAETGSYINTTVDLQPVRMAWWRAETNRLFNQSNSSNSSNPSNESNESNNASNGTADRREGLIYQRAAFSKITAVVERIVMHTTWLDQLDTVLSLYSNLSPLWWYRAAVDQEFYECLTAPNDRSGHIMAFLNVWKSAASDLTHPYYPEDSIAHDASVKTEEYLNQASKAVVSCFRPLFNDVEYMSHQTSFRQAAIHLHARAQRKQQNEESGSKSKGNGGGSGSGGGGGGTQQPGYESRLPFPNHLDEAHRRVVSLLRTESIAKNICSALTSTRKTVARNRNRSNNNNNNSEGEEEVDEDEEDVGFKVHNTIYYPSIVLRERLRTLVGHSVRTITEGGNIAVSSVGNDAIIRPTRLLSRIKHVLITLHRIATTSFTHDVERIVREELLRNCWDSRYAPGVMGDLISTASQNNNNNESKSSCGNGGNGGGTGNRNSNNGGTSTKMEANSMVHCYGRKYIHLIENLLTSSDDTKQYSGIVWSEFKQGFIRSESNTTHVSSSSDHGLRPPQTHVPNVGEYATLTEWVALCQLIGPQGMRCIEHSMYHIIAGHATTVRAFLSTNRNKLEKIRSILKIKLTNDEEYKDSFFKRVGNDDKVVQESQELEMTNDVIRSAICMGHALKMRGLIREATRRVLVQKIPNIYNTVRTAYEQYDTNLYLKEEYVAMDRLARECGIDVGAADHALIDCMKHLRSDRDDDVLWSLLPYAFGCIFTSNYWIADKRGVQYLSSVGAMTNNSHVLVTAVDALITCFTALKMKYNTQKNENNGSTKSESENDGGVVLKPLQIEKKRFVECAAYNLLYMRSMEHTKEWKMYPVRSMFAILEKFVIESNLDRSILDSLIEYPLLHAAYVEMSIGKNRGYDDSRKSAEAFLDAADIPGKLKSVEQTKRTSQRRKSVKL